MPCPDAGDWLQVMYFRNSYPFLPNFPTPTHHLIPFFPGAICVFPHSPPLFPIFPHFPPLFLSLWECWWEAYLWTEWEVLVPAHGNT